MEKTLYQLIEELKWFNLPPKLKEILHRIIAILGSGRELIIVEITNYDITPFNREKVITVKEDNTTLNLPTVESSEGAFLFVINDSMDEITVVGDDIWSGGMQTTETIIPIGAVARILNNGEYWIVL